MNIALTVQFAEMKGAQMVGLLAVTGGALVSGFGVYRHFTNKAQKSKPKPATRNPQQTQLSSEQASQPHDSPRVTTHAPVEPVARANETTEAVRHGLRTSSVSLGLATTGLIFFPPLQYACIPTLIYMGIPPAQRAYEILSVERRGSLALGETIVLGVCLASGLYWVGSLGFSLYYVGRTLSYSRQPGQRRNQDAWHVPHTARLRRDSQEVVVPTATLQRGNQVIVHSSEMVPADGVIIEGSAWLRPAALMYGEADVLKHTGDSVNVADIVLVGQLCVQVREVK